jgi:hypothetical protein
MRLTGRRVLRRRGRWSAAEVPREAKSEESEASRPSIWTLLGADEDDDNAGKAAYVD